MKNIEATPPSHLNYDIVYLPVLICKTNEAKAQCKSINSNTDSCLLATNVQVVITSYYEITIWVHLLFLLTYLIHNFDVTHIVNLKVGCHTHTNQLKI